MKFYFFQQKDPRVQGAKTGWSQSGHHSAGFIMKIQQNTKSSYNSTASMANKVLKAAWFATLLPGLMERNSIGYATTKITMMASLGSVINDNLVEFTVHMNKMGNFDKFVNAV